jgi:hypothetical protein
MLHYLSAKYQRRQIGQGRPVAWSARSQDFIPLDFFYGDILSLQGHTILASWKQDINEVIIAMRNKMEM